MSDDHEKLHRDRRRAWRQSHGGAPGVDGLAGHALQPHLRPYRSHQEARRDRTGKLRGRAARVWPAGAGHLGYRRGVGAGRDRSWWWCPPRRTRILPRQPRPTCKDGQIVVLHPGRTCGAIEFAKVLRDQWLHGRCHRGRSRDLHLCQPLRWPGPGAHLSHQGSRAAGGAAGHAQRSRYWRPFTPAYPQFIDGVNVLHTGLNNMGAIFHPALTLLNAGWIESTHGDYQFYIDGVTPRWRACWKCWTASG